MILQIKSWFSIHLAWFTITESDTIRNIIPKIITSKEQNMFVVSEHFLSSIVDEYRENTQ